MKLIVDELHDELYQKVTRSKNTVVVAVRPHIYRHGNPSGSLRVLIQDTDGNTIATSESVDIADIGSDTYFHGYVRFNVNAHLRKDTEYRITIEGVGYTYNASAYIGVCNGYDLGRYAASYETGTSGYLDPLDIELWERRV